MALCSVSPAVHSATHETICSKQSVMKLVPAETKFQVPSTLNGTVKYCVGRCCNAAVMHQWVKQNKVILIRAESVTYMANKAVNHEWESGN